MDYVFDLANSFSYVGVTPTPTTIAMGLMFVDGEGLIRIGTSPGTPGDPATAVDLTPLAGYWLPI